jgi:hypothetical protein
MKLSTAVIFTAAPLLALDRPDIARSPAAAMFDRRVGFLTNTALAPAPERWCQSPGCDDGDRAQRRDIP